MPLKGERKEGRKGEGELREEIKQLGGESMAFREEGKIY